MKIEDIGKAMPFQEDKDYVAQMLAGATERAIRSRRPMRRNLPMTRIAAMLVILLTVGSTGWIYLNHRKTAQAPLDTFLENMSEEDLILLRDYCADESMANGWEWEENGQMVME